MWNESIVAETNPLKIRILSPFENVKFRFQFAIKNSTMLIDLNITD